MFLWWRTQTRIERTRDAISAQVVKAVGDINGRVDTGLEGIETRIDAKIASLPTPEALDLESAVNEALEPFKAILEQLPDADAIGDAVSSHVKAELLNLRAQETKRLQEQLEQLGVADVIEEGKEQILAQLPPGAIAFKRMMDAKVSKKWAAEHPIEAQLFEGMKVLFAQYAEGQGVGMMPGAARATDAGGEFRPGVR